MCFYANQKFKIATIAGECFVWIRNPSRHTEFGIKAISQK